jgi:hypothetical protein
MLPEDVSPAGDDPLVREFLAGIAAWEQPLEAPARLGAVRTGGAGGAEVSIRGRGTVRTRGGGAAGGGQPPAAALAPGEPVAGLFRAGIRGWEYPLEPYG